MSTLTFADTQNMVAFLEKPAESDGFHEIIDFLNANHISYALTVNPIIYTSYIQQFWAMVKATTVNGERQLQALIDKKKVIITESSIRSDLHLEDAGGADCLPTATIFEELAQMSAKCTAWNESSSTMASLIICLATNQRFNMSKYIFDAMLGDMSHHKKIYVNPSHTKKIFANMKREGKDFSGRITPLFETMMVQANQEEGVDSGIPTDSNQTPITIQPSSSRSQKKQSRRKQRKDIAVTQEEPQQDDSVPTPSNDPPLSGEDSMQLSELMILCTNLQKQVLDLEKAKDAQVKEIADLKKRVQVLERKKKSRTTGLKRLRKVVIQIKASKPKVVTTAATTTTTTTTRPKARGVVVQEPSEFRTLQESQPLMIKDKGKAIMIEPEVPLKRKDQVFLDEDLARNLQAQLEAELIEEERLARKQEEEANIALINYEEIQKLFDNEMRRVNTFILIDSEVVKSKKETEESFKGTEDELKSDKSKKAESSEEKAKGNRKKILGKKRAGKEQQQESSKRQRMEDDKETDEHEEVEVDDEAELKKHLVIVKDDDIAIDAIPLTTKPPVIVEYKLFNEGIMTHYQLIRVDGSSKRYSSMIRML
ncbi:hypothetical protein Tco_0431354 [Tanacetum coccineum]